MSDTPCVIAQKGCRGRYGLMGTDASIMQMMPTPIGKKGIVSIKVVWLLMNQ